MYPIRYKKASRTLKELRQESEPHDRLIGAIAVYLNIPLLTNDPELIASQNVITFQLLVV
jgi:predicted nucleic acid-binding protein